MMTGLLQIPGFARRAGVSVRTLRHYDRLGLLKPAARTKSQYRLYAESDLPRLEQIIALRALGLSLTVIKRTLTQPWTLAAALGEQSQALLEQRRFVTDAIDAISDARRAITQNQEPDWKAIALRVKHGGAASELDRARRQVMERRRVWAPGPEDIAIAKDIKAALEREETPESPAWKMLIDRLKQAIDRFTGGDPALRDAVKLVMNDSVNWPSPALSRKLLQIYNEALAKQSVVH